MLGGIGFVTIDRNRSPPPHHEHSRYGIFRTSSGMYEGEPHLPSIFSKTFIFGYRRGRFREFSWGRVSLLNNMRLFGTTLEGFDDAKASECGVGIWKGSVRVFDALVVCVSFVWLRRWYEIFFFFFVSLVMLLQP